MTFQPVTVIARAHSVNKCMEHNTDVLLVIVNSEQKNNELQFVISMASQNTNFISQSTNKAVNFTL